MINVDQVKDLKLFSIFAQDFKFEPQNNKNIKI